MDTSTFSKVTITSYKVICNIVFKKKKDAVSMVLYKKEKI